MVVITTSADAAGETVEAVDQIHDVGTSHQPQYGDRTAQRAERDFPIEKTDDRSIAPFIETNGRLGRIWPSSFTRGVSGQRSSQTPSRQKQSVEAPRLKASRCEASSGQPLDMEDGGQGDDQQDRRDKRHAPHDGSRRPMRLAAAVRLVDQSHMRSDPPRRLIERVTQPDGGDHRSEECRRRHPFHDGLHPADSIANSARGRRLHARRRGPEAAKPRLLTIVDVLRESKLRREVYGDGIRSRRTGKFRRKPAVRIANCRARPLCRTLLRHAEPLSGSLGRTFRPPGGAAARGN